MAFLKLAKLTGVGVGGAVMSLINRDMGRRFISRKFGEMPGLAAKISQAMTNGMGPPMGMPRQITAAEVAHVIRTTCPALHAEIDSIDEEVWPASIGQVNRVMLRDGRTLAVKIRYPGIERELEEQLDTLFSTFSKMNTAKLMGFDVASYKTHFMEAFKNEVDYKQEAENQKKFANLFNKTSTIHVPDILGEYSNEAILTQIFVSGRGLDKLAFDDLKSRTRAAEALATFQMISVFGTLLVHGDMHAGNWGYNTESGKLVVYDFGSVFSMSAQNARILADLISESALSHPNADALHGHLIGLGFDPQRVAPVREVLPRFCAALFGRFDPTEAAAIMGGERWRFRSAGPPWFFSLLRSCSGVWHALARLRIPVPFPEILRQVRGSYRHEGQAAAAQLYVSVHEGSEQIVLLEFPAQAVDRIDTLMPESAMVKIRGEIDLNEIKSRARNSGYVPQALFAKQVGTRRYQAWLG